MEIAEMKRANMDTHNLLTKNTTPNQTINDHRTSAHFTAMTQQSDILFDRKHEKLARIPTSPTYRHRKPNHQMESGTNKLPIDGCKNKTV
jgi:hypothetical protein